MVLLLTTLFWAVAAAGDWLDVAGAAERLNMTERFIRRLVAERRIRYYKCGKFIRLRPEDLDAWAAAGEVQPVPEHPTLRSRTRRSGGRRGTAA